MPKHRHTLAKEAHNVTKGKSKNLDLDLLSRGMPGLTQAAGTFMAECASVCLEDRGHQPHVLLGVSGDFDISCPLLWSPTTKQMRSCHNDKEVATEYGAYGIAILLLLKQAGVEVLEKSVKGGGFDYWLGRSSPFPFQKKARLEVSGIREGDSTDLERRVKIKIEQTKKSDGKFPAYVVVVEFGSPRARVVKR